MNTIYLDHAATAFPKAQGLGECMQHYFDTLSVNINRSTYASSTHVENIVYSTRELLCELFHFNDPSHVIFTPGITHSLNYIIKGYLKPGDHCLISPFEHNAVVRPLCQLEKEGISYDLIDFEPSGTLCLDNLKAQIRPNTKLVILTHASNVFGNILPIEEISNFLSLYQIPVVLDTAQTAGHIDIDFYKLKLSALCFTGHKGLLGPSGIGGMLLTKDFANSLTPLIAGGTGSASHLLELPPYMPDKFESGTLNIGGIYGLHHALSYLKQTSISTIHHQEMLLTKQFIEGLIDIPSIKVMGDFPLGKRVSTVSIQFLNSDNANAAYALEQQFGILTRCGLHCTPLAHQFFGTYPEGTVRFSFGHSNTQEDVHLALEAISQISNKH